MNSLKIENKDNLIEILAYNEENGKYYQIENGKMIPVSFFDKYK